MPDLLLSCMNFLVYMESLVNGNPLGSPSGIGGRSDVACLLVSVIMYTIVICTYFAPVTVGFFTFVKLNAAASGRMASPSASLVHGVCLILPLTIGLALAIPTVVTKVDAASVLGQYRGLYCFVRRWEFFLTGGLLLSLFGITILLTVVLYGLAAAQIAAVTKQSSAAASAPYAVMRRGLLLVLAYVTTWIWFTSTSFLAYQAVPASVQVELIGAIIINAQPLIDAAILFSLRQVRRSYHERHLVGSGLAANDAGSTSTSSSSVSSSSFFAASPRKEVQV